MLCSARSRAAPFANVIKVDTLSADRGVLSGPGRGPSRHSMRLAWVLAAAYLLIVAYASLQPFRDWRVPPGELWSFITGPWPRYITGRDVLINILAYVPLGFLLAAGFRLRFGPRAAVLLAAAGAAAFSLGMECVQVFLPARIASNIDLLTNGTGGLVGALLAPVFSPTHLVGERLVAWRDRWFVRGIVMDIGLIVVGLWILAQLHPTAQLFGSGNLRGTFDLPTYTFHTPSRLISAEAAVVLFNFVGLALMVSAILQPARHRVPVVGATIGLAIAVKAAAAVLLFGVPNPLSWLTPGVALGLVAGVVALFPLLRMPRTACLAGALICILAAVATINLAPDNPYQTLPAHLLTRGHSHLLSFSGIARAISELWPLLAVGFLVAAAAGGMGRVGHEPEEADRL